MSRTVFAFAVIVVVAVAGWARAGDTQDMTERLKAMEARLAAVEKGTPLPSDGILRVRGLVVQDGAGKDRIVIGEPERTTGIQGIAIRDADGRLRVELNVGVVGGSRLGFIGPDEKYSALLASDARGSSLNMYAGADSKQHLILDVPSDGAVGLGMWGGPGDRSEQSHAGYWVWKDGTIAWGGGPRSPGKAGFGLKYDREGKINFEVRDPSEAVVWQMPSAKSPLR